jgi:diguanylate cyclase (GGDEF)-like protein/PAS domain S-box-containing protein
MKRSLLLPLLIGLTLVALGATVMTGWLTHNAALVQILPGFTGMVFNTAVCFFALGTVFILSTFDGATFRLARTVLVWGVIALAGVALFEVVTHIGLGINWRSLHEWLDDTTPVPGNIAISTGVGFILCGVALVLMDRPPSRLKDASMHLAILGVMLTGLTGLTGVSLRFDLIYPSLRAGRMAVQTAVGMMLVAAGLWAIWFRIGSKQARYPFREDDKISFVGGVILTVITLTVGMVGLSAQVATLEQTLSDKLAPMLEFRSMLFQTTIRHNLDIAQQAAERISAVCLTSGFRQLPRNAEAVALLHASAQSLLQSGFSGVALLDTNNRELLREGRFVEKPAIQATLGMNPPATLLWGDGYYLNSRLKIFDNGTWIGTLVSEQPLPEFVTRFFNAKHIGVTGEIEMCLDQGQTGLACFPQSGDARHIRREARLRIDGRPTAMSRAIAGEEGMLIGLDYRGDNTIAQYRPLGAGLGLVVKQDTAELFQPIRRQVEWTLPFLLLSLIAGTIVLRFQVKPIATRLLRSERDAKEKEHRIRAILDNVAEGIITLDERGVIESFNGAAPAIFGYTADEVAGKTIQILLPPELRTRRTGSLRRYLSKATRRITAELTGQRKDGAVFPMEFATSELQFDGRRLTVLVVRDITGRKQAEAALFEEKERLSVTLGSIGDAVITTDTQGCVSYMNPVAERMTGWSNGEAAGRALPAVFHIINERTSELAINPVEIVLRSEQLAGLAENTMLVHRDGTRFAIEDSAAPIRDRSGKVIGVVLVFHDVSQSRKIAAQMSYHATHDDLTGLVNRREFEHHLQRSLQAGEIAQTGHTLLYLDLDRFKIVNDTCGHEAGDELLRQLSSLLQAQLRRSDRLARLGGDEFCVLLDNCPTGPALRVAEKLLHVVSDFRFVWQGKVFPVGISIGLVTFNDSGLTPPEVLRRGDAACYVAKDKGRNRVQVYTPDDTILLKREGEAGWLERIRQAFDEDRFMLYAQRILPLKETPHGEARGVHFELLLRMVEGNHIIPPMAFLPVAERYCLMPAIDRWVIRTAFASYVECDARDSAPGTYAINLSGASISDDHFLSFVLEQFAQYAVPPHKICFEITETSAIANLNHAAVLIRELKSIGCRFSLDDFGTGMSSFAYLKHLPVDYLKIDGAFVKDMTNDPIDFAMVESINHIGHVMGIQTIAEFVENDAIFNALREVGVDFAQGYGIARPVPLDVVLLEMAMLTS